MQKLRVLGTDKIEVEFAANLFAKALPGTKTRVAGDDQSTGTGYFAVFVDYQSEYAGNSPVVLVLDPALGDLEDLTAGLEGGGWVVLNLPETSSEGPIDFDRFAGYRLAFIDAVGVVASVVGRPNLQDGMAQAGSTYFCGQDKFSRYKIFAMLGVLSRVLGEPSLAEIKRFLADDLDMDRKQSGTMGDCEVALKLVQGGYDRVIIHGFVPRAMSYGKLS